MKILDTDDSITFLLKEDCSIARYGDGELEIMLGKNIHFQNYDPILAKRLINLLKNNRNEKLKIGVPLAINTTQGYNERARKFWEMNLLTGRMHWYRYGGFKKTFLNASFTRCYMDYELKEESKIWFERLMGVWQNKNILIVEGYSSKLGVGNSLFSNAQSIKRILTPSFNSWDSYDVILSTVVENSSGFDLILASIGPTATILAADVSSRGLRIIDIGHLNVEYDKYKNDGNATDNILIINEVLYQKQVIYRI